MNNWIEFLYFDRRVSFISTVYCDRIVQIRNPARLKVLESIAAKIEAKSMEPIYLEVDDEGFVLTTCNQLSVIRHNEKIVRVQYR